MSHLGPRDFFFVRARPLPWRMLGNAPGLYLRDARGNPTLIREIRAPPHVPWWGHISLGSRSTALRNQGVSASLGVTEG